MNIMDNKKVLMIIIVVLSICCISLGICFKLTKGKTRVYEPNFENKTVNDKSEDNNDNKVTNNEEESDDGTECEKYELVFKSNKKISKDYSSLISKLDYTIMTRYYCYNDVCKNLEKQLLEYYKSENPNSDVTSGFADYYVKLSNGKINETVNGKTTTLNGINNVKSVIAHFNVEDSVELFYLDNNDNLYYYRKTEGEKRESKLIYKNVRDFTVIEGNDYLSSFLPSEGANITVALHTKDNKFMISYYGFDKFINIKNIDYLVLTSESSDYPNIYLSTSKNYTYETHNKKEIIVKELFVTNDNLYLITDNNDLLYMKLESNYCKDNYKLYKDSKVDNYKIDKKALKFNIKFKDNSEENIEYVSYLSR